MSVLYLKNNQGIWEEVSTINGHTPVITASKSNGITTIYADGMTVATINDGEKGEKGEDGETPLSAFPNDTVSGQIVHITDGADDIPMDSVKVNIEPVQDLHGQEAPYPAGGGKNLFGFEKWLSDNEIAYTKTGDSYTFTLVASLFTQPFVFSETDAEVTLSFESFSNGTSVNARMTLLDSSNNAIKTIYADRTNVKTTGTACKVRMDWQTGGAGTVTIKAPQIELGSVASSFAPYSNICPISGWTGAQVVRTGVNVWDEEFEIGIYNVNTGEKYANNNAIRTKNRIAVLPNATYYTKTPSQIYGFFYDSNGDYISGGGSSIQNRTFMTPSNAHYMNFYVTSGYGTTYNHDISINYPATDTDYHPYTGDAYSITLPTEAGTVYGGELDITNGVLTVDRAMVDLGSLNWSRSNNNGAWPHYLFFANIQTQTLQKNYMCSVYPIASLGNIIQSPTDKAIYGLISNTYIYIRDDDYATATDFKSAVTGQTLVYKLATPTTYHLTPTEIKSLYGENNIYADCGSTSVTYRADTTSYIEKIITATKSGTVTTVYVKDKPIATINDGTNGKDYTLTTQDKEDIAQRVINILPTAQGVSF